MKRAELYIGPRQGHTPAVDYSYQVGIDENGLGPRLGPLLVTAVMARATGRGAALLRRTPRRSLRERLGDSKRLVAHGDVAPRSAGDRHKFAWASEGRESVAEAEGREEEPLRLVGDGARAPVVLLAGTRVGEPPAHGIDGARGTTCLVAAGSRGSLRSRACR